MKNTIKSLILIIVNLILAVIIGFALLIGVFSLPTDKMQAHLGESASTFAAEGTYPVLHGWCQSQLDNFTDSIMLQEAADGPFDSNIWDAIFVTRGVIEGQEPSQILVSHYRDGESYTGTKNYPRYWHGYLVLLKPLLMVMNYIRLRKINGLIQVILAAVIVVLLLKRKLREHAMAYAATYIMLQPVMLAKSMQFSTCYYLLSIGCLALLLCKDEMREKRSLLIFLNLGIATAYFDYFTYPLAVFGIPALFFLALQMQDGPGRKILITLRNGICWAVGYACMWGSKWVLATKLTGFDILQDAHDAYDMRTSDFSADGTEQYSILGCEQINYLSFLKSPLVLALIICAILIIIKVISYNRYHKEQLKGLKGSSLRWLPYLLVGLLPAGWYAVILNHSMMHYWFTYKSVSVSVLAFLFLLLSLKKVKPEPSKPKS